MNRLVEDVEQPAVRSTLRGLKVLLVEDNFLVARSLQMALTKFGCQVIGPLASVDEANRAAATETIDGAVLDINIDGGHSGPVAEALRRRGKPFFFITGYSSPTELPADLQECRRLNKPVREPQLLSALQEEFAL